MAFTCLLFYTLSAILGGILSWLLLGGSGKKQIESLQTQYRESQVNFEQLLKDFNKFKTEAKFALDKKDVELQRLKKISNSAISGNLLADDKKLNQLKSKIEEIDKELSKTKSEKMLFQKTSQHLEKENSDLKNLVKQLKAKPKLNEPAPGPPEETLAELEALQAEINIYKKKFKKLKKASKAKTKSGKKKQKVEIVESLDLEKLSKLILDGTLVKKTKKVSKKK